MKSDFKKLFQKSFKKVLTNGWRCDRILKLSKDGGIKFPSGARKFNAVFKRKREARAWRIRGTLKIEQQTRNELTTLEIQGKIINFGSTITKMLA